MEVLALPSPITPQVLAASAPMQMVAQASPLQQAAPLASLIATQVALASTIYLE